MGFDLASRMWGQLLIHSFIGLNPCLLKLLSRLIIFRLISQNFDSTILPIHLKNLSIFIGCKIIYHSIQFHNSKQFLHVKCKKLKIFFSSITKMYSIMKNHNYSTDLFLFLIIIKNCSQNTFSNWQNILYQLSHKKDKKDYLIISNDNHNNYPKKNATNAHDQLTKNLSNNQAIQYRTNTSHEIDSSNNFYVQFTRDTTNFTQFPNSSSFNTRLRDVINVHWITPRDWMNRELHALLTIW